METTIKHFDEELIHQMHKAEGITSSRPFANRIFMSAAILGSDTVALVLSGCAAVGIRAFLGEIPVLRFLSLPKYVDPGNYLRLMPALILFVIVYASRRLYPTIGLSRVDEVRLLTISTSLVVTLYTTVLFFSQQGLIYSRLVFALFWLLAIFLVPISRVMLRRMLVRLSLWGVPVGIVGSGPKTAWTVAFLNSHPNLGFKPTIIFDGAEELEKDGEKPASVPLRILDDPGAKPILGNIDTLVVIQNEISASVLTAILSEVNSKLPRIMMMPDLPSMGCIWVYPVDLGGVLAIKIRNNLANPWQQFQKRVVGLTIAGIASLLTLPLFGLIAIAIKLDTPGPIFFIQERVGKGGITFPMLKFRTMYFDAEMRLQRILSEDPDRKVEWERYQKFSDDPRITRTGSFLRSLSLDELPQLWNVLRGEMSLVGPRPFFLDQKNVYGKSYNNYIQVRPGITGIWQVDGRNRSSFLQRAEMDEYYVRNWSVWLDLNILARTPIAVFSRDGAY